tara:strand:+ start:312 stop:503 length:192 start_codon:yes stop_codon:yes gene_type:complete
MSAFGMQVACGCHEDGPFPMEPGKIWDGEAVGGFTEGRRYVWTCANCGTHICVNMKLVDEDDS